MTNLGNKNDIIVSLEACEPMELMRGKTPENVWLRISHTSGYWPEVEVRGPERTVWEFVSDNWGEEVADASIYGTGPFA